MTNILSETALAVIKPDAIRRGLENAILTILLRYDGMDLTNLQRRFLTLEEAQALYLPHTGKDFFEELVKFMLSDEVILIELRGRGCAERLREAVMKIREMFVKPGNPQRENLIHGSDSREAGQREVELFFGQGRRWPQR